MKMAQEQGHSYSALLHWVGEEHSPSSWEIGCFEPQLQLMVQMERLHVAGEGLRQLKFAFTRWRY